MPPDFPSCAARFTPSRPAYSSQVAPPQPKVYSYTYDPPTPHSTTPNITQVQSLKSGSTAFPVVTFSSNENTLHVTNTDNSNTQTLQSIVSKTQVGSPLSLQLS